MDLKKNEIIELTITDMTKDGLGLAKKFGQVFFVKDGLVGDVVNAVITKVTSNIVYAKALEIIKPSEYRVDAICSVSKSCGGCQLLELKYEEQLKLKSNNVINCLTKIGGFDDLTYEGIIGSVNPLHFRNKMQVPFSYRDGKIVYGFYAGRTHHIVEFECCEVGFVESKNILNSVKNALEKYSISIYNENDHTGVFKEVLLRKGNVTNEISITYIINDSNYNKNLDLYKKFDIYVRNSVVEDVNIVTSTININTSKSNVLFGNKNIILYGNGYIEDKIGDIRYHISPESFYQVNMEMTKKLYDKVLEYADLNGDENVLDLYCGIGTISLFIARYVKNVQGIEIVEKAAQNATDNARINGLSNAKFLCFDAENIDKIDRNMVDRYDIIIVDPPRKGLDIKTIDFIKKSGAKKIVYVSCDPATLSRDLSIICDNSKNFEKSTVKSTGYKLHKVISVDMFPHTMHVETVAVING